LVPTFSSSANRTLFSTRPLLSISPRFARLPPPVIVIGMHRSGTSLVSGMLSILGAYMDPDWPAAHGSQEVIPPDFKLRSSGYGEAVAFRLLNERLLSFAGSDWDDPHSFLQERTRPLFIQRCLTAIGTATYSRLRREFLDRSGARPPAIWGWKDPRNSLTLPFWLEVFPHARILHVRRDGMAVADSLLRREAARAGAESERVPPWSRFVQLASDPARLAAAIARRLTPAEAEPAPRPSLDRDRCHVLTEQYLSECLRYRSLGPRYEEIHYEDILRAPRLLAAQMADFAGLTASTPQVARAAAFVNADSVDIQSGCPQAARIRPNMRRKNP
jgi:hypothetical protein